MFRQIKSAFAMRNYNESLMLCHKTTVKRLFGMHG